MAKKKTAPKTTSKTAPKKPTRKRTPRQVELPYIAEPLRPLAEPLDKLLLNPQNAVKHDQASIDAIAASLKRYGQRQVITVNAADNVILAGNGRYQAARAIGWSHLAVLWVKDDPAAATGYAIADNRTAEFAAWDDELLAELLAAVHSDDADLFAALELSELCEVAGDALLEPEVEDVQFEAAELFRVTIECVNKTQQKKLYDQLLGEGYTVALS